jgi:hypothetical protein
MLLHRSRDAAAGGLLPASSRRSLSINNVSNHFLFVPPIDSSEQRERGNMLFHRSSLMVTAFHSVSSRDGRFAPGLFEAVAFNK